MTQEELILKYAELKRENARLRDGIEKVKAEIEERETYEGIYLDRADILGIIDEYLGEER